MHDELNHTLKKAFANVLEGGKRAFPSIKWPFIIFMVCYLLVIILVKIPQWQVQTANLTIKERLHQENENRKTIAQIIGGGIAIIGIYLAWRRIRATEKTLEVTHGQLRAMERNLEIAQDGQITERFTRAIEQLGSDKLEVRLGGIYALERIARDSEKDHWPIMEILTNYVRVHAPLIPDEKLNRDQSPGETISDIREFQRQHPSRDQIIGKDSPPPEIQAILTVIGRRKLYYLMGEEERLNLREVNLRWLKLERAHLEGAFLQFTDLTGAVLIGADLGKAYLFKTKMKNADLDGAHLEGADLSNAEGLTRGQIGRAIIDNNTELPEFDEDD